MSVWVARINPEHTSNTYVVFEWCKRQEDKDYNYQSFFLQGGTDYMDQTTPYSVMDHKYR